MCVCVYVDLTSRSLQWASVKVKIPKCHSIAVQGSTDQLHLILDGVEVRTAHSAVWFLDFSAQDPLAM